MMFIIAKPATAIAFNRRCASRFSSSSPLSANGIASKPTLAIAVTNCGSVISGKCETATRLAVKLTRAFAIPDCRASPLSNFAIQPAHRMPETANSVIGNAMAAWFGVGAVIAIVPHICRCRRSAATKLEWSNAPRAARPSILADRQA